MSRVRFTPFRSGALLGAAITLLGVGAARSAASLAAQGPDPAPVVREALVSAFPAAAPGQQLQLVRYVIQPGTTLPAHTHPGVQIGLIESGTLHYVVVEGETPIYRKGSDGGPASAERIRSGGKTDLHPGDRLVESEGVVHYGANRGDEPVVIWCATLLDADEPPANVVGASGP